MGLRRMGRAGVCALVVLATSVSCLNASGQSSSAPKATRGEINLIPNGDFQTGPIGGLPAGWKLQAARPALAPVFGLVREGGRQLLMASGGGNSDCVGYVAAYAPIRLGRTYRFEALFRVSDDVNPHENLLFQAIVPGTCDGIFTFKRLTDGWAQGDVKITYPGQGSANAEIRIYFRLSAQGKAWVKNIRLAETQPTPPRWVKVACTSGLTDIRSAEAVLNAAGDAKVDLVLLPEYMRGALLPETLDGPGCRLMSAKAKQYGMYVAGGIVRKVDAPDRLYNTAVLYDRKGKIVGMYDKHHPYSPELNTEGISAGVEVPVFQTEFGKIGMMICYDTWFTDVAQLLALKGAKIILFPNAGYYRSLMPARAADNCVRIVASSWNNGYGVWDTAGRSVVAPDADPTVDRLVGLPTFKDVRQSKVGRIGLLIVSLDLESSPSPVYNGGTMMSAPGGRRNRAEQRTYLEDEIKSERRRWWEDD